MALSKDHGWQPSAFANVIRFIQAVSTMYLSQTANFEKVETTLDFVAGVVYSITQDIAS